MKIIEYKISTLFERIIFFPLISPFSFPSELFQFQPRSYLCKLSVKKSVLQQLLYLAITMLKKQILPTVQLISAFVREHEVISLILSCSYTHSSFSTFLFDQCFLFIYLFIYFLVNFVIHWNETAMGLHVLPIQIPPYTSLSTRSP